MATKPKLDADLSGTLVDQTDYRSKIGSLMYLTSSRPDIVQAICYCARYQARPTEKHLTEMPDPCRMHYYSQKTSGVNKFLDMVSFILSDELVEMFDSQRTGVMTNDLA
ncbi:hypothetical protein Tco_1533578 [Tanacetum coccineum]